MQNALIIGPIAAPVTEAGFAQSGHDGQAFADSFCEYLVQPGPAELEAGCLPAAVGTFVWNDGLLSAALRDRAHAGSDEHRDPADADLPAFGVALPVAPVSVRARTGSISGSVDLGAAASGLDIGPATHEAGRQTATGPLLHGAAPGAAAAQDSPVPPDERAAAIPSLDGQGKGLPPSGTSAAQSPPLGKAEAVPSWPAPAGIAAAGDKAADGDPSGAGIAAIGDDGPGRAVPVTAPFGFQGPGPGAFDAKRPMTSGRSEDGPAARLPASGFAVVRPVEHPSGSGALHQPSDPPAGHGSGHGTAPEGSLPRPDGTSPCLRRETVTGLPFEAKSEPEDSALPPSVAGSFWERVFHDATRAQAAGASQPAVVRSAAMRTAPGTLPADGAAIPAPVSGSAAHASEKDQIFASVLPAQEGGTQPPDPTGNAGKAPPPATISASDLVSRLVVEAWPDPVSVPAVEADALPVSGLPAPSAGPAGPAAVPGPHVSLAVPQVAAQVAAVLRQSADGAAELSLAPAELGRVRLRMVPDARDPDRLLILINVERPETLELFRRHAAELSDAIRSAGYSGSSIDFGQQGQGNQREAGRDDQSGLAVPEPGDTERGQLPLRNVTGETLDLRL